MSNGGLIAVTHVSAFGDYEGRLAFAGAENHLFELMRGQRAAGLDVELMMLIIHDGPRLTTKAEELAAEGIVVKRFVYDRSSFARLGRSAWVTQLPRLVELMRPRVHRIIHTHQPHASQLGRLAAWWAGARAIVDSVHNDEPFFANPTWRLRLRLLDRITGLTIAISQRVKTMLVEGAGLRADRIEVISYGIAEPSRVDPVAARAALGLPGDAFVVGFVGRLTPQKDVPVLLRAMVGIEGAHTVIVGAGDDEASLKVEAARLNLNNVHFLGGRPNAAHLMPAFDVFALPSKWEGLGLVLLEAMVRGVPIVASRGGAIPEVLLDGELGLLSEVGDVAGFRTNIERLRADPDLRRDFAARGYAAAQEHYTVSAMVQRTSAVYRRVLEGVAATK